ncbi:MAG: hypothetical protein A3A86_00430 [Elusimicrobia bacterium RIFCSPLOWO2_01_FULL_60_11]|nr:MAG: hypothetical protein A3A86_00430 [Elusimicrobia bacterium RIFCSPLOWO2_01_FULL_60_11]
MEGPYEPQALKYIDGFTPDILVSPDLPEAPETWTRFSEIAELQAVINQNPKTSAAPVVIEAPSIDVGAIHESPVQEPIAPEVPRDEFTASTEMLDLMQKISKEMEQKKAEAPARIPDLDLSKIKPLSRQPKASRAPALVAAVVLVIAGLAFLAVKTNAPRQWFNLIAAKFHKTEKIPAAAKPEVAVGATHASPVQTLAPAKPAPLPIITKAQPKTTAIKAPVVAQKPATPEEQKKLATQKFYLPGVPSPKLAAAKVNKSEPLPEVAEEAAPADEPEEKVNYGKSAKGAKGSGNADWMKQASWGD